MDPRHGISFTPEEIRKTYDSNPTAEALPPKMADLDRRIKADSELPVVEAEPEAEIARPNSPEELDQFLGQKKAALNRRFDEVLGHYAEIVRDEAGLTGDLTPESVQAVNDKIAKFSARRNEIVTKALDRIVGSDYTLGEVAALRETYHDAVSAELPQ
jgi:hypothetical protein